MSIRTLLQSWNQLNYLFFTVLIGFGYFNEFLIVDLIGLFIKISSLTGQVLVNKFLSVCICIFDIIKLTYLFFQVLYEDSLIFLKDATDKVIFVIFILQQFYFFLEDFARTLFKGLFHLAETISIIFGFLYNILVTVKEGIQLTGLTIWNFFTVMPERVTLNINEFIEFLTNTINELKNSIFELQDKVVESLWKTYLFLFDVSVNSVYGLIIGAVLLTIIYLKFKDICFIVTIAFLKLYQQFTSLVISLWSGRFLEQKSRKNIDHIVEDDERVCIICQYHLKEIIIFPCKHLCLCKYCSLKLTKTKPLCPICRSDIIGTLKVYL